MLKHLTATQIARFHRDGYCFPIDIMSREEAAGVHGRLEGAEARYPEELNAQTRNNGHYALTCLDEIAQHPVILDAVEDLVGPSILLWASVLFIKEAGDTALLVRGHDSSGHFRAGRRPERDMSPDSTAFRRAANQRMSEILYDGAAHRRNY